MKNFFGRLFDVICGITVETKVYEAILTAQEAQKRAFNLDRKDLNVSVEEFNKGIVWLTQYNGLKYKILCPGEVVRIYLEESLIK